MSPLHTALFKVDGISARVDIRSLVPHAASLPVAEWDIDRFQRYLEDSEANRIWDTQNGLWIGPAQILQARWHGLALAHIRVELLRCMRTNLAYPIWTHQGDLFDGFHRLTKARLLRKRSIRVQEWPEIPKASIIFKGA